MNLLHHNINTLANIGEFYQKKLNRLKINTLFDLVTYAPRLYETRKKQVVIRDIRLGEKNAVAGKILDTRVIYARRRMLLVTITDGTGLLTLRFFHFYPNQVKQFATGMPVYAFGEVRLSGGNFEMLHPQCRVGELSEESEQNFAVYPLSEGLTQNRLYAFIRSAFGRLRHETLADLPEEIINIFKDLNLHFNVDQNYFNFLEALYFIHFPPEDADFEQLNAQKHPAQVRLIFEELLAHRLALKQPADEQLPARKININRQALHDFLKSLPFSLTAGQNTALTEILEDLQNNRPMQRLLQGDVGSGKTMVAFLTAFAAIQAGAQVVLMAPTEILAEQLYQKAEVLFAPFHVRVAALLGKITPKIKKQTYAEIEAGTAQFIIGTHAVIQDKVIFKDLGLIIIDEQHRFGVGQRLQLHQKGTGAAVSHQLMMSATPIPRTLAMTLYADLNISNIYELPAGRKPIETVLISDLRRDAVITRLREVCIKGEQAYWICPLIEESEKMELEAAEVTYSRLCKDLPGITIALLHGRMKSAEKTQIMQDFKDQKIQLLIATTVVEVGVDVPNASIMIIENPERMGLSQLHQLRGRVGRGHKQSFCVLLYHAPLSETGMARLTTLKYSQDGFALAEKDLELRGPGEFLGTRQTGGIEFRFASLIRDQHYLKPVHHAAEVMRRKYPEAAKELVKKWFASNTEFVKV